jgi:hypothetical protein
VSDLAEADPAGSAAAGPATAQFPWLLRDRSGSQRVTNIELFFDLVYVSPKPRPRRSPTPTTRADWAVPRTT